MIMPGHFYLVISISTQVRAGSRHILLQAILQTNTLSCAEPLPCPFKYKGNLGPARHNPARKHGLRLSLVKKIILSREDKEIGQIPVGPPKA